MGFCGLPSGCRRNLIRDEMGYHGMAWVVNGTGWNEAVFDSSDLSVDRVKFQVTG
jgi:hypothetical protein